MLEFKIPKKPVDLAIVLNTPTATDATLETGLLTLLNEQGTTALKVKISDIVGWQKTAYSAGVAHIANVALASFTPVANNLYALSVEIPNVVNPESKALGIVRTYTVSADGTPTAAELTSAFVARINLDTTTTGVTATVVSTTNVRLTASSVTMGRLLVKTAMVGAVVSDTTAYVAPVGTPDEVNQYIPQTSPIVTNGNEYTRYRLVYRKLIPLHSNQGTKTVKDVETVVYAEENAADFSDFTDALDAILDGTATAADYLGAPSL
jgi:hypothetical protein